MNIIDILICNSLTNQLIIKKQFEILVKSSFKIYHAKWSTKIYYKCSLLLLSLKALNRVFTITTASFASHPNSNPILHTPSILFRVF